MGRIYAPASKPQEMFLNTPDWVDICFYGGQAGGGKRVSNETKILTNHGWVEARNITFEHKLVAVDGSYTDILGIYPAKNKPTYELTFSDGQKICADAEHQWEVKSTGRGTKDGWVVKTTEQIFNSKETYTVPLITGAAEGKEWKGADPYTLGYNLENNKCFPEQLLTSDPKTRLSLLQGLMDRAGRIDEDGSTQFITTNANLRDGVMDLVRSLGGRASFVKKKGTNKDVKVYQYFVKVFYGNKFNPFRLKDKRDKVDPNQKLRGMEITSIKRVSNTDGVCFTVSHPRHLFVIEGYVVTHNTFCGLLHHLKYADDPLYRGLVLRRTTPMIMKPGAVWDEAKELFSDVDPDGKIKIKGLKYEFSTGAEVSFSHFEREDDKDNFQGAQISSCVMEELCQFTENQFNYILSRLRTRANMKPNMRATMNPDPDSWVRKYVDWYLYPQGHKYYGRPDPSKQGVIRWFVRKDNELIWADTKEELEEKYKGFIPLSFRFIAASVHDNPYISETYIAFLNGLPTVEREILLHGNWEARPVGSSYFDRDWLEEIDVIHEEDVEATVRTFDFAGTLPSDINRSPDYTASVRMRRMKDGTYVIDDVKRLRIRSGDWFEFVMSCAEQDPPNTTYYIPEDPNPAAKRATQLFIRDLAEAGLYAKKISTNQSKLDRFRPFSAFAQSEGAKILSNCGVDIDNNRINELDFYYRELEAFTGRRKRGELGHDDMVDATSDAFYVLASTKQNIGDISGALGDFAKSLSVATNSIFSG